MLAKVTDFLAPRLLIEIASIHFNAEDKERMEVDHRDCRITHRDSHVRRVRDGETWTPRALHPPYQMTWAGNTKGGKYHFTLDLLFDWFGISCMTIDSICFNLKTD